MKILFNKFLLVLIFGLFIHVPKIQAITYPVPTLGNCPNQLECYKYCEIPENKPNCWSWKVYSKENILGAKSPETKLKELNITFPIAELNNCPNLLACKEFCKNDTNKIICANFSQNKNLTLQTQILTKSKSELNCNSWEDCRNFCNQKTNQKICSDFTKKYQLKNTSTQQILNLAYENFGCTNLTDCKNFCLKPENKNKCQDFAKKYDLLLLNKNPLSSGCQTNNDCQKECEMKKEKCPSYPNNVLNAPLLVSPNPPISNSQNQ